MSAKARAAGTAVQNREGESSMGSYIPGMVAPEKKMIHGEREKTPRVGRSILKIILCRSPRSTPVQSVALGGSWRSSRMQLAMKWGLGKMTPPGPRTPGQSPVTPSFVHYIHFEGNLPFLRPSGHDPLPITHSSCPPRTLA